MSSRTLANSATARFTTSASEFIQYEFATIDRRDDATCRSTEVLRRRGGLLDEARDEARETQERCRSRGRWPASTRAGAARFRSGRSTEEEPSAAHRRAWRGG